MIKIIALTGKAGAGKTTVGNYIQRHYSYTRLRFADGLKRMLREGLGISDEYVDGHKKEVPCPEICNVTVRHAMRTLGTEWGRNLIHPNIWVEALDRKLHSYISDWGVRKFVIDDLRFINEAEYLYRLSRKEGYTVVIVDVSRVDRAVSESSHTSETEMNYIESNHTIFNDYDLETLYDSVSTVMGMYFGILEGEE